MGACVQDKGRILEKSDAPTRQSSGSPSSRGGARPPIVSVAVLLSSEARRPAEVQQKARATTATPGVVTVRPLFRSGRDPQPRDVAAAGDASVRTCRAQRCLQEGKDAMMVTVGGGRAMGEYEAYTFNAEVSPGKHVGLPSISANEIDCGCAADSTGGSMFRVLVALVGYHAH